MFLLIIDKTESETYKQEKSKQEKSHIKSLWLYSNVTWQCKTLHCYNGFAFLLFYMQYPSQPN